MGASVHVQELLNVVGGAHWLREEEAVLDQDMTEGEATRCGHTRRRGQAVGSADTRRHMVQKNEKSTQFHVPNTTEST